MSRIRSDIPIYAFTRHEATRRRVTLYRGVYPGAVRHHAHRRAARCTRDIFTLMLLERELVEPGDRIILTKGELSGVSGGTNTMKILEVAAPDRH